jgi:uncharacterized repeat protein (TIGR02543 family)
VDFDSNGGGPVFWPYVGLKYDSRIQSPGTPSRKGYVFQGWYLGENRWNFDTDTVRQNITLVARWAAQGNASVPKTGDYSPPWLLVLLGATTVFIIALLARKIKRTH